MENHIWTIIALVAGLFIGKNWDKIKKKIKPYAETVTQKAVGGVEEAKKFLEEQKAKIVEEQKAKIVKKPKKVRRNANASVEAA